MIIMTPCWAVFISLYILDAAGWQLDSLSFVFLNIDAVDDS
jgi:hypothetical protein